jgi:polyferredoxin
MRKITNTNPYRLVLQITILALIGYMLIKVFTDKNYIADFEAYCPYGGLLAFSSFLENNSLACSMTSVQIAMGAALIIGIILFSKLFCSFICPIGTISEWIGKQGDKLKVRYTITGYGDILLRGVKYAILFVTFYYTVTSSELFCKKFDPYYAAVSGFTTDVSLLWGIVTIAVVVIGSFFVRLFWCKYLCPIGAVSNIFRFFFTFLGVTIIYLILLHAGIEISFIWPLAIICAFAYILEFMSLESRFFPLFRIRRNTDICTNCNLCNKNCPVAIDVASLKVVRHIDCHLCGDCIHVCPEKGALTINKRGAKWWPAAITLLLVISGLIAGRTFEIPTLSQYWGENANKEKMQTYTKSGLKSVKCYGSSVSFANQMRNVGGVTGVTTYVKTNTVRILFDPSKTDTISIQRAIFTPVKIKIRNPGDNITSITAFNLRVDKFFDPLDAGYLKQLLSKNTDIVGFTTEFDCPVKVTVYTNSGTDLNESALVGLIEKSEIEQLQATGKLMTIKLKFAVTRIEKDTLSVSPSSFYEIMNSLSTKSDTIEAPLKVKTILN